MILNNKKPLVIIYTDYSSLVNISQKSDINTITSIARQNLKLILAVQFLSRYPILVRYKAGKDNTVPNTLSRLQCKGDKQSTKELETGELEALFAEEIPCSGYLLYIFIATLVEISDDFCERLIKGYKIDKRWSKVITVVKNNKQLRENTATLPFELRQNLLYRVDRNDQYARLCIPSNMIKEIFDLLYGEGHPGYIRFRDLIDRNFCIPGVSKAVHDYLRFCPQCQQYQTKCYKPYSALQPILALPVLFYTISIDFILALPVASNGYNVVMIAMDKLIKKVSLIPGKDIWTIATWGIVLVTQLLDLD
jgi:hypothetical protein